MVYVGLEGPRERQKTGGGASKRMAGWCALAGRQQSCRIRLFSDLVSGLDDLKSNHTHIAPGFLCLFVLCKEYSVTTLALQESRIGEPRSTHKDACLKP
jgi:hypothetical protein